MSHISFIDNSSTLTGQGSRKCFSKPDQSALPDGSRVQLRIHRKEEPSVFAGSSSQSQGLWQRQRSLCRGRPRIGIKPPHGQRVLLSLRRPNYHRSANRSSHLQRKLKLNYGRLQTANQPGLFFSSVSLFLSPFLYL
jgi:hypothetical protein